MAAESITLITPTWRGDLAHFRLLRESLEHSGLSGALHKVVVQSEDLDYFTSFVDHNVEVLSTSEVLPEIVERLRIRARSIEHLLGRHLTRQLGSLARISGWPDWPKYTGWHTQQICKLKLAAEACSDYAVVIDSDVVVCPDASPSCFLPEGRGSSVSCYSTWAHSAELSSKVRNWVTQATKLLGTTPYDGDRINHYFDTPFIFHVPSLNELFRYLEDRYRERWWDVLLKQPPRRWSEFATYKAFLALKSSRGTDIEWSPTDHVQYIFDASDPTVLLNKVRGYFDDPVVKFVTVHSQSKGRQLWSADSWVESLLEVIREMPQ